jgi:CubicO group peptidase (beta-lactamase class C family)
MFFEDLHHVSIDTLPGTTYQYSNVGVKLLGIILERVYHMSYGDLLAQHIARPFGMTNTRPSFQVSDTNGYMKGYDENGQVMPHNNFNMFGGSGAILSTTDDMLLYMRQNIDEANRAIQLSHQQTQGDSTRGIGLCWEINRANKHGTEIWKDGGALGFRTYLVVVPTQHPGIVWLANKSGAGEELGVMVERLLNNVLRDH